MPSTSRSSGPILRDAETGSNEFGYTDIQVHEGHDFKFRRPAERVSGLSKVLSFRPNLLNRFVGPYVSYTSRCLYRVSGGQNVSRRLFLKHEVEWSVGRKGEAYESSLSLKKDTNSRQGMLQRDRLPCGAVLSQPAGPRAGSLRQGCTLCPSVADGLSYRKLRHCLLSPDGSFSKTTIKVSIASQTAVIRREEEPWRLRCPMTYL